MNIAINIGNTNIAVAYKQNQKLIVNRLNHNNKNQNYVQNNLQTIVPQDVTSATIASVVPSLVEIVAANFFKAFVITKENLTIDYSLYDSTIIGLDRLLICQSALKKYKPPLIVCDIGTAITINVIDKNSKFLGGAILPGIKMGLKALNEGTAKLPHVSLVDQIQLIGNNTNTSLLSGALYGTASIIDGMRHKIEKELNHSCNVIITGGGSKYIIEKCTSQVFYEEELLLEALLEVNI